MRYTTQSSTPGAPGNLSPFRHDGISGLANRQSSQVSGPRIPISYGTEAPVGNALGVAASIPNIKDVEDSYRISHVKPQPVTMAYAPKPLINVDNVIRQLAAQQGAMPIQPVASRTHGTVGGIGNSAWCN